MKQSVFAVYKSIFSATVEMKIIYNAKYHNFFCLFFCVCLSACHLSVISNGISTVKMLRMKIKNITKTQI